MIFWSGSYARVILGDARIVPGRDLAQKNVGQHIAAEPQIAHARDIEDRHNRAKHGGNVNQLDLRGGQHARRSSGMSEAPKSTSARRHLADSATRTDRLVVDLDAGMRRAVLAKPLGIDGIREMLRPPRSASGPGPRSGPTST